MFKSNWSNKIFTGRKTTGNYRQGQPVGSHGGIKGGQDFLSNIVEEGSMEDLPKTFEQEEQYMEDCLDSLRGSTEDVQNFDIEEYDFDDYNSIASTTSMLNLNTDNEDRGITSPRLSRSTPPFRSPPPNGCISPPNTPDQTNGLSKTNGTELSNLQKSLSRVQDWDRLGKGGEQEDWSQVLIQAAEAGDLITVQDAVTHLGATKESLINSRDVAGNTPIHKAAQMGKLQCLKWLVKRAPPEAVTVCNYDNMTPAAMATQYGQVECLEWLVDQTHAKQELDNENSFTLLHYAAKEGQEECLRYLLSYIIQTIDIADIYDSNGLTPAHLAAREGHLECLQLLIEFDSDVKFKDREGCTPSDCAFKAGQTGCGKYLIAVEMLVDLSARLNECRKENQELRSRIRVLESHSHVHMPDRPEAVGGDQSDSSSTVSMDSIIYPGNKTSKFIDAPRRSSSAPDGESPKGIKKEGTAYEFQVNGYLAPSTTSIMSRSRDGRRGSFPLTCWEKANKNGTTDQQERGYMTSEQRQTFKTPSLSTRNEPTVINRISSRTPNTSTPLSGSTTKNASHLRVHFEDTTPLHGGKAIPSPTSTSVSSSRSQSPFRSDRSTAISNETVLVATPVETHKQSPHRDSRRLDRVENNNVRLYPERRSNQEYESNNSRSTREYNSHEEISKHKVKSVVVNHVKSTRELVSNVDLRGRLHSDGLLKSSESTKQQVRLSWHGPEVESDNTTQHITDTKARKENFNRKLNDFELLSVENSVNQNARRSWHGPDGDHMKLPFNQAAHAPLRNSSRSPVRKARVTWGDQSVHAMQASHQTTRDNYHLATPSQDDAFFGSTFTSSQETPWYETEEVEL